MNASTDRASLTDGLFSLAHKNALITGGSSGLGWIMARALAERGADVMITSRSSASPFSGRHGDGNIRHIGLFDLSSDQGVDALAKELVRKAPTLDILINNAGVYRTDTMADCSLDAWNETINSNLKSIFFLSQALAPHLKEAAKSNGRSRIINIGSVVGRFASLGAVYSLSKAALHHLTALQAKALAADKINVNAIAPGAFRTPATADQLDALGESFANTFPTERIGVPEDLAGAIVFLTSRASEFITGHVLPLDGGYADLLRGS